MLYLVKLEDLPNRYTIEMHRLLVAACERNNIPYSVISGTQQVGGIEVGAFLDANKTTVYKAEQMRLLAQMFQDKTIPSKSKFLFYDLWFPGLEALPYMAHLNGVDIEVYGIYHAGSWTEHDYVTPMAEWAGHFEAGWAAICRKVFVGSYFLRRDLLSKRDISPEKVAITGLPYDHTVPFSYRTNDTPKYDIIFPHRPHWEKGLDTFYDVCKEVGSRLLGRPLRVVFTSGGRWAPDRPELAEKWASPLANVLVEIKEGLSKEAYFQVAAQSAIVWSSARQENYGFAVQECMAAGAMPVVLNTQSYKELVPEWGRVPNLLAGVSRIHDILTQKVPHTKVSTFIVQDGSSRMLRWMFEGKHIL